MKQKEVFVDRVLPARWVKNAQMWCVTSFEKGKQVQTWHKDKPDN